ncbi:arginine deiminase family protein [Streptomyces sp. Ag109_O5-1]|uniref:arginine deiminase family protein n=1 Tax=Streptomyces sp. Ag109_O5-1 TaxID=1938851 RepID=UPI0021A66F8B|nr:arginine deiminase family protein [Streptomyces sp. Ag109_O5-1]
MQQVRLGDDADDPALALDHGQGADPPVLHSLVWSALDADDFALAPLPNHLFPRDNSCWIYDRLSVNPMAKQARRRESLHAEAIYRFHPLFAGTALLDGVAGTLEGGDVHVLGNGSVMVGMGERTTAQAVENLAARLFADGTANRLIAVQLPSARAFMHLDTVLTMVDRDAFTIYPGLADSLRSWTLLPSDTRETGFDVTADSALAEALDLDKVRMLSAPQDIRGAEREQWDDGSSYLAVLGDARNNMGNSLLSMGALLGMDVRIAAPAPLWPDPALVTRCRELGERSGARILLTEDVETAVRGAEFLHTDVWVSMGEPADTWRERIELLLPYQVNDKTLAATGNPDVKFMHCLPALHDRSTHLGQELFEAHGLDGLEVTDEVFASPASIDFDQAENRLHTIKAVLVATLED